MSTTFFPHLLSELPKSLTKRTYLFPYLFVFIFFLYINFLTPLVGDDWEVSRWFSVTLSGNVLPFIKGIFENWLYFNGRALANYIMPFFCYYKILWNFFSAGVFTLILYLFGSIFGYAKNTIAVSLSALLLMSISSGIRHEVYSLVCANVLFMIPLLLTILYVKTLQESQWFRLVKQSNLLIYFALVYCLFTATLVEHISASFTMFLFILNGYYFVKNRRLNGILFASLLSSGLGSLFMFTSPGMKQSREMFDPQGLWLTLRTSLNLNLRMIIFDNNIVFSTLSFSSAVLIIQRQGYAQLKRLINYGFALYFFVVGMLLLVPAMSAYLFPPFFYPKVIQYSFSFLTNMLSGTAGMTTVFWSFYLMSVFYPISLIDKQKRGYFILLGLLALLSLIPSSIITQVGHRIISNVVFIFIGITAGIFSLLNLNSIKKSIITLIVIFGIFNQFNRWQILYRKISDIQNIRNVAIERAVIQQYQRVWDYSKPLIVPSFAADHLLYTANPPPLRTSGHYLNFKLYHGLDERTIVIFDDGFGYSELRLNSYEKNGLSAQIFPLDTNFNFEFILKNQQGQIVKQVDSEKTTVDFGRQAKGVYTVECIMKNSDNKTKRAYSADEIKIF